MARKSLIVLVASVSGLVGGAAAIWISNPPSAKAAEGKSSIPDVIEARRLVVKDQEGHERVTLGTKPDGGAGITVLDRDGNIRINLHVLPDDAVRLAMGDKAGNVRIGLEMTPEDTAGLTLSDKSAKVRLAAGVSKNGDVLIACIDTERTLRLGLQLGADGTPDIAVYDKNKRRLWGAPLSSSGQTADRDADAGQRPGVPQGKAAWRQLKVGMSQDEVRALLGEPGKVVLSEPWTFWYYGYPIGGQVDFKQDRVSGWREP